MTLSCPVGGTVAACLGDHQRGGLSGAVLLRYPAIRPGKPFDAQGKQAPRETLAAALPALVGPWPAARARSTEVTLSSIRSLSLPRRKDNQCSFDRSRHAIHNRSTSASRGSMTTTTPDIPPVTGGVLLFRSCLISDRVPRRRGGHQVALRALRHRVHRASRADLLHRPGLLLRAGARRDLRGPGGAQRLRRRRRRPPRDELPVLHLLRHQQEGAQHPEACPSTAPRPTAALAKIGPRLHRRRGRGRAPQPHHGDPVERPPLHPRHDRAPPRRHQGRDPPRLPLLQGLPRRGRGRQRELHDPGGPARGHRRHQDRPLQREDDALRRRLPPALRQPLASRWP